MVCQHKSRAAVLIALLTSVGNHYEKNNRKAIHGRTLGMLVMTKRERETRKQLCTNYIKTFTESPFQVQKRVIHFQGQRANFKKII